MPSREVAVQRPDIAGVELDSDNRRVGIFLPEPKCGRADIGAGINNHRLATSVQYCAVSRVNAKPSRLDRRSDIIFPAPKNLTHPGNIALTCAQINPHSPDNALSFGAACAIQI